MSPVERTLAEEIPGSPAEVRAVYVDLDAISELHPLVTSVRTLARRVTGDGYEQIYRIKDVVPLVFLGKRFMRLPVSYTAVVRVPTDGPVTTRSTQFPRVRLDSTVSFEPTPTGTLLTERIRFSAPPPLLGVTVRQAVAAHTEMLAALRRRFERARLDRD